MAEIKVGDKVRVKDKKDWPSPPGFILANAEGTVIKWVEDDEIMGGFEDFIYVHLEKAVGEGKVYIDHDVYFQVEDLEKV